MVMRLSQLIDQALAPLGAGWSGLPLAAPVAPWSSAVRGPAPAPVFTPSLPSASVVPVFNAWSRAATPPPIDYSSTRLGLPLSVLTGNAFKRPERAAARGATGGASGVAAAGSPPAAPALGGGDAGSIWGAIDEVSGGDARVALAMKLAVQMESGGRLDAVGDNGRSHGPFQIYQGAHAERITPEQSRDPYASSRYMLPEFQRAVGRVEPGLWQSDPMRAAAQAAFYAERPAAMYPDERVRQAYATVTTRGQTAAPATVSGAVAPAAATPQAAQGLQAAAIAEATKHVGMPYLLASQANNPKAGAFDCSGLVQWSYGQAGVALPRVAQAQYEATTRVSADQARPGDLVFFTGTYNAGTPVTHVGIYLGGNKMLQAGSGGVGYADLSTPYWRSKLYGFGRVGRAA